MQIIKRFFARETVDSKDLHKALKRMQDQMKAVGGQFTFDFKIDNEGWVARCKEFDGIVTGGIDKNPSEKEVMKSLIDSIKTAFDVPINEIEIEEKQAIALPTIRVVREFQFC
ncbi:hypothetical protein D4R51_04500 [bacterium]|nr:MAG: hypothetical protein D4R51_04500 [bacterium]